MGRRLRRFMAGRITVTPQNEETVEKEVSEIPLLDLSDAAVKKVIRSAKKRGYVTHDQVNALLSSKEVKSEQIEDILAMFSKMGVNVVQNEEATYDEGKDREEEEKEEPEGENELVEVQQNKVPAKAA